MGHADQMRLTEHHLVPRFHHTGTQNNVIQIPALIHQSWHRVFGVRSPEQVVVHLVQNWLPADQVGTIVVHRGSEEVCRVRPCEAQSRKSVDEERAFALIFPSNRPHEILKWWAWHWIPTDYFSLIDATIVGRTYLITPDQPDQKTLDRLVATERRLLEICTSRPRRR